MCIIELALVDQVDVVRAQFGEAGVVYPIEAHLQIADGVTQIVEKLLPASLFAPLGKGRQTTHVRIADPVEFVEVVREDPHEAHALDQWHLGVLGLLQHACVEGEPAEFLRMKGKSLAS